MGLRWAAVRGEGDETRIGVADVPGLVQPPARRSRIIPALFIVAQIVPLRRDGCAILIHDGSIERNASPEDRVSQDDICRIAAIVDIWAGRIISDRAILDRNDGAAG